MKLHQVLVSIKVGQISFNCEERSLPEVRAIAAGATGYWNY
ncbi:MULTISPECIES: hypothetical protein [Trichocoleus]|nr:hypothetical protein [Trichocoleus sp. FACHB-46]